MQAARSNPLLGEWLAAKGVITQDQLQIALHEQRHTPQPLGRILVHLRFITEAILRDALSINLGLQSIDLAHTAVDRTAVALISKEQALHMQLLPLALDGDRSTLTIAMINPNNLAVIDQLHLHLKNRFSLEILIAAESELYLAIDRHYEQELSIDGILHEIETGEIGGTTFPHAATEYSQPVVRLIDALLTDAAMRGASDIHFEPEQAFVRIRYRIDGVLHQIRALHSTYWPAMVVRLKVMTGMNIAETRAPQDGRLSLTLAGRALDFRISAQPTSWGENIVLRILDRQKGLVPLDQLGLSQAQSARLRLMIARPEGILLVTGPTGAGKTTTLYSILDHINSTNINIMTLEDPVEYPIPLLRQTSINETVKMDFAAGVRSILRQDPDVILIGEIRDQETADMAFRAAMTGHQVYSTLHTHSASGAIARLLDLGLLPDVLAGNIIGIIAQRLLRKLCPKCRSPHVPDDQERTLLGLAPDEHAMLYRAQGCLHCANTGYKGRLAIMEILRINHELDDLIARRATAHELNQAARNDGFRSLAEEASDRVLRGETSLDEAMRVVNLTERIH